jgi:hypothetical protein
MNILVFSILWVIVTAMNCVNLHISQRIIRGPRTLSDEVFTREQFFFIFFADATITTSLKLIFRISQVICVTTIDDSEIHGLLLEGIFSYITRYQPAREWHLALKAFSGNPELASMPSIRQLFP